VLIGRRDFFRHRTWCFSTVVLAVAAVAWYAFAARKSVELPGGSSLVGLALGIAGGAIILFEFLLWPRKKVRAWRIGSAQGWLRAHIWLGLLSVPLIVLHSGFVLGSPLSTVLMVLFLLVIASGIFGLAMQNYLPKKMLEEIPAETICSQIEAVAEKQAREAEEMVLKLCGDDEDEMGGDVDLAATGLVRRFRQIGSVRGTVLYSDRVAGELSDGETLRLAYYEVVDDFLKRGRRSASPLKSAMYAQQFFAGLRTRVEADGQDAITTLESLCDERRQFDRQARMHFWLHSWLWIHLPLSVALVVLMFVHVYVALKYL
jgi:hypothetical protein